MNDRYAPTSSPAHPSPFPGSSRVLPLRYQSPEYCHVRTKATRGHRSETVSPEKVKQEETVSTPEFPKHTAPQRPDTSSHPLPTFHATLVPLPIIHDPPTLLTLPVHSSPSLHVTANLVTPEPFAPWLPDFREFILRMIALHPPPIGCPGPAAISEHLTANTYAIALFNTYAVAYVLFSLPQGTAPDLQQPPITIDLIHTHPAHRRHGAAAALLREVGCFGVRRRTDCIQAWTPSSPNLLAFWKGSHFDVDPDAPTTTTGPYTRLRVTSSPCFFDGDRPRKRKGG